MSLKYSNEVVVCAPTLQHQMGSTNNDDGLDFEGWWTSGHLIQTLDGALTLKCAAVNSSLYPSENLQREDTHTQTASPSEMSLLSSIAMPRLTLLALLLAAASLHCGTAQETAEATDEEITPYIIFATSHAIYRSSLQGADIQRLVHERSGRITALDYNYRLGHMYWAVRGNNVFLIKQALLNGSNDQILAISRDIQDATGIAVDWMNDKLYWSDRQKGTIEQYNLDASSDGWSTVIGRQSSSTAINPFSLAIIPAKLPEPSLLAWTDQTQHTLESLTTTGEQREIFNIQNGQCGPGPLTTDYSSHMIYWLDYCSYAIKGMTMDTHEVLDIVQDQTSEVTPASNGLVSFNGSIYWTKLRQLYHFDGSTTTAYTLNYPGSSSVTGMQIVHPSRQPLENEVIAPVCESVCSENAECLPSGECACKEGYTGDDCSESTSVASEAPLPETSPPPTTATASTAAPAMTTTSEEPITTTATALPTTTQQSPTTTSRPETTPPSTEPPTTEEVTSASTTSASSAPVTSMEATTSSVASSTTSESIGTTVSMATSPPPTDGLEGENDKAVPTRTAILIAVLVAVPCIIIAVVAVVIGIVYCYRKARKQRSWSPKHPDSEAQMRTTFRLLDEPAIHLNPPPIRQQRRTQKPRYTIGTAGSDDSQSFDIQLGDSLLSVRGGSN